MISVHSLGACLPTFGNCADRYCLSGYGGGGKTVEEMLDLSLKVEGLDGLELVGNWHVNDENVRGGSGGRALPDPRHGPAGHGRGLVP